MSTEYHKQLNSKLWEDKKLKPEVKAKLKEIADAFIDFLEVPAEAIKDVVITGSSASYNYTPQSDIDLHLLVDYDKVHKDCPIVQGYLLSKKSEFNQKHDIFIYGIPVEVYAESINNDNVHNGLFSLRQNKWIDEPKPIKPVDNDMAVNAKYKEFAEAAEEVRDRKIAEILIDKIKKMRKSGLEKAGEFSVENLVFKKLRNNGVIEKLMNVKKEEIDKELSLKEAYEVLLNKIEEMMGSTAVMAPYANPVVGQENPSKYQKQNRGKQRKAVLGYKYQKIRGNSMNESIKEKINEVIGVCEAIKKVTLHTGAREGDGSKEYTVRTTHDSGKIKTKVRAQSPEQAKELVQKIHGGPMSAHKIEESLIEEIMSTCEGIINIK